MADQTLNPFAEDQPHLVHLKKSQSHYEYCRMQMHEVEHVHRRTFIANCTVCIMVCILAVFHIYIDGFGFLSKPYADAAQSERATRFIEGGANLAGGIFQVLFCLVIIALGYLAWANFHSLNIILETWYLVVTGVAIFHAHYLSAVIGVIGVVFYFFSLRAMQREQALSEMDGYPEFQEDFDISKSDIVIQTLLAHKGERRTKSTLFTTDYSLRRKKKKKGSFSDAEKDTSKELADTLQKHLDDTKHANTAIAVLDAVTADHERSKQEAEKPAAEESSAQAQSAEADAILADAEEKAEKILAEAKAKAAALNSSTASAETPSVPKKQQNSGNPQRKKKKH